MPSPGLASSRPWWNGGAACEQAGCQQCGYGINKHILFHDGYLLESFPALALLYQYDEELLLEHFQTVGVHEGRQGNERVVAVIHIHHEGGAVLVERLFHHGLELAKPGDGIDVT